MESTQDINLVDLPDCRPRDVVVVQHPPDRPWRVRIVKRSTPERECRASRIASIRYLGRPELPRSPEGCAFGFAVLLGLLLGEAAMVLLFRVDLFDRDATAKLPSAVRLEEKSFRTVGSGLFASSTRRV
ncbi:hypothetical protein [Streptomyces sp. NPDC015680]|uniref:hypothetical protein n=1 Tax=Streptomyces sp. NPDC015680 TaxID=3364962 RepID=UPI0036FCA518